MILLFLKIQTIHKCTYCMLNKRAIDNVKKYLIPLTVVCLICGSVYVWIGLIRTNSSYIEISTSRDPYAKVNGSYIIKDYRLRSLIRILNDNSAFFKNFSQSSSANNEEFSLHFSAFLAMLRPWLVGEPQIPLKMPQNQSLYLNSLDCSNPRYKSALSGRRLSKPRFIVDFIPFGYDLDKLEIRLIENFFNVDIFVIFESQLTQTGGPHATSTAVPISLILTVPSQESRSPCCSPRS